MATCFACFGKVAQSAPDQSHSLSWDVCAGPLSQRNLPEPVRATTARTSGAFFLTDIRALARCCCCFSYLSGCEWLWTDSWSCCIQVNEGPSPSRFAGLPTSVVSGVLSKMSLTPVSSSEVSRKLLKGTCSSGSHLHPPETSASIHGMMGTPATGCCRSGPVEVALHLA